MGDCCVFAGVGVLYVVVCCFLLYMLVFFGCFVGAECCCFVVVCEYFCAYAYMILYDLLCMLVGCCLLVFFCCLLVDFNVHVCWSRGVQPGSAEM